MTGGLGIPVWGSLRTLCLQVSESLWQGEGLEGQTWGKSQCLVQAKGITPSSGCSGHLTVVGEDRSWRSWPGLMAFLTRCWGDSRGHA